MAKSTVSIHGFNAGECSYAAMARVDQEALKLAAEKQENLVPYVVGKAIMRPGTEYLSQALVTPDVGEVKLIPFVRDINTTALIELNHNPATPSLNMRVYWEDDLVSVPPVNCTMGDPFMTGAGGYWVNASTGNATVTFSAPPGALMYAIYEGGKAVMYQSATTSSPGLTHALYIETGYSPVDINLRIGSTQDGQDLLALTALPPGIHTISFVPTGTTFFVQFETTGGAVHVMVCDLLSSGGVFVLPFPTPIYSTNNWASLTLSDIRYTQSLDVIFLAINGSQPMLIQHRGPASWSICNYFSNDGPFQVSQSDPNIYISPSQTQGTAILAASQDFFSTNQLGELLQISHSSTSATYYLAGLNTSTTPISVTGIQISGDRSWSVTISGTWSGVLSVERSFNDQFSGYEVYTPMVLSGGVYVPGPPVTISANGTLTVNDADDNAIVWYRLTFTTYNSGAANLFVSYGGYGATGMCRILSVNSPTSAGAQVLTPFSSTASSNVWLEGEWSDARGWPTATALYDGRLWWARDNQLWGSVSDSFWSMAAEKAATTTTSGTTLTTDSSSIQRYISTGGSFDDVKYMLPLQRLIFGTSGAEVSARSSSLDEPLTPTNITLRDASSQGSADVQAVKVDKRGIMVQRSTHKLYAMVYNVYNQDYDAENLMRLNEDIGWPDNPAYSAGFTNLSVQRQPETYIWATRSDGILIGLLYEPNDKVQAFFRVTTGQGKFSSDGVGTNPDQILQAVTLPQEGEDSVYWLTQRYLPAPPTQAQGQYSLAVSVTGAGASLIAGVGAAALSSVDSGIPVASAFGSASISTSSLGFSPSNKGAGLTTIITSAASISSQSSATLALTTSASAVGAKIANGVGRASMATSVFAGAPSLRTSYYAIEKAQTHYNTLVRGWDNVNLVQTTAPGLYQLDAYTIIWPTSKVLTGLNYLMGRTVMALGYSAARSTYGPLLNPQGGTTFVVSSTGTITLGEGELGPITVGIPYYGNYKSAKLAYGAGGGNTALLQKKLVEGAGLLMQDTHPNALMIGSDFNGIESMDPLPRIEDLLPVQTTGTLTRVYDKQMFPFANSWDTDARVCIQVQPGYSATLSALVVAVETNS